MAALAQSLVTHLDDRIDRGAPVLRPREWVLRQNKWRAGRHGLEADIIVDDSGAQQPVRDAVRDLVAELVPVADRLGCGPELARIEGILTGGASYARQRAAVPPGAQGAGGLQPVVDLLVAELASDTPGVLPSVP